MKTKNCRFCGRKMIWGVTEDGAKVPLDPSAPIYFIANPIKDDPIIQRASPDLYMVNHFKTCPKASQAGKGKKA